MSFTEFSSFDTMTCLQLPHRPKSQTCSRAQPTFDEVSQGTNKPVLGSRSYLVLQHGQAYPKRWAGRAPKVTPSTMQEREPAAILLGGDRSHIARFLPHGRAQQMSASLLRDHQARVLWVPDMCEHTRSSHSPGR